MPIVVDTSAVIAVAGNEPLKARLIDITRGQELFSPATLFWEIGNAISAMFKQKRITEHQGLALVAQCRQIGIQLVAVSVEDSIKTAAQQNVYAYDAYMLQCAKETGCAILTLDGGLREATRRMGIPVLELTK